jgi:ribosomal protein S14
MTDNLPWQCRKDPEKQFLKTYHCDEQRVKTEEQLKEEKNYSSECLYCPGCVGPARTDSDHIVLPNKKVVKDKKPVYKFKCDKCEKPLRFPPSTGLCRGCYLERAKKMKEDKKPQKKVNTTPKQIKTKTVCSVCGAYITGIGKTGMCRCCIQKKLQRERKKGKKMGEKIGKKMGLTLELDFFGDEYILEWLGKEAKIERRTIANQVVIILRHFVPPEADDQPNVCKSIK